WEGMPNGTLAKFVHNFESDVQLVAHFKLVDSLQYELVYTSNDGGKLEGDSVQLVVLNNHGTSVTAIPYQGFTFQSWSDSRTDNPRIDSNDVSDISVDAIFGVSTSIQTQPRFDLKIYPNPVSAVLTIEMTENKVFSYQILHPNGQVLKTDIAHGVAFIDMSS